MRILAGATTALRRIVDLGLVCLIVVVLLALILGKGAPVVGRQTIVIGGGSMEPAFGVGAAIVIRPIAPAALAVGDVVSLQVGPERTTFTHRIIALVDRPDGRWIRTQGDANAEPDPTLVPATAVIGKVEFAIPLAGYLLALLSLPMGVMFVLGLAATLLAIAWLLESLELDQRPTRRRGSADQPVATPEAGAEPPTASGLDVALTRGEPIATRGATSDDTRPVPTWVPEVGAGSSSRIVVDRASATVNREPSRAALARPTVREQLARNREDRNRRARWSVGRDGSRRATD